MNLDAGLRQLLAERDRYDAAVAVYAAHVREELLVPLCKRLGYTYTTGNGTFSFTVPPDGEETFQEQYVSDVWEVRGVADPEFMRALRILNTDVYSFNHGTEGDPMSRLGYYVTDVTVSEFTE